MNRSCIQFGLVLILFLFQGCGGNIFSTFSKDSSSAGDSALSSGDYDTAIDEYEDALDDPDLSDDEKKVIRENLAAAYMGRSGVDVVTVIEKSASAQGSGFDTIMAITPDASSQNIADINKSVALLKAIDNPSPTQNFQKGLAETTQAFLIVKQAVNAVEGGGEVVLDASSAATAVSALAGAADSFSSAGGEDTEGFGDQVEALNAQILADPEGINGVVNGAVND